MPYTAATDRFRLLTADPTARSSLEWAQLEPEARVGKFFLAAVEDERLLEALRQLVDVCLEEGVQEAEFIHRARGLLGEMVDPVTGRPYYDSEFYRDMSYEERVAYDRSVTNLDSAARLKLIFRTQWELGAGYAEWQRATRPDHLRRFPAWRFVRQPGAKIKRADHVEHEEDVRLISDLGYWLARNSPEQGGFNQPYPPWGYNSWMRVEYVRRLECEQLGLLAPGEVVSMPPEAARWCLPRAVGQSNTSSAMDALPPEAQERVVQRCREQGLELLPCREGYELPSLDEEDELPAPAANEASLSELLDMLDLMMGDLSRDAYGKK